MKPVRHDLDSAAQVDAVSGNFGQKPAAAADERAFNHLGECRGQARGSSAPEFVARIGCIELRAAEMIWNGVAQLPDPGDLLVLEASQQPQASQAHDIVQIDNIRRDRSMRNGVR